MKIIYFYFGWLLLILPGYAKGQIINTIAGTFYGDGQTAFAIGIIPTNQVVDAAGNIYFSEPERHIIRKLSVNGFYSTVAGTGIFGYSGNGGPATAAQLGNPFFIARDIAGNLFIADSYDNRIKKINTSGIITTIAGTGSYGFSGDGGPAVQAQLSGPNGIAVDNASNIYIIDFGNNRVRKISSSGIITTIAGTGVFGGGGNGGPSASAQVGTPLSVAVNSAGELFIADVGLNNIRKVGTNGIITAFAGPVYGGSGFGGDGGPATAALFNEITGIATDAGGNVFVADRSNNRVRKINSNGIINTIAGIGVAGSNGDNGPATSAQLLNPNNVTTDASGNLLITTLNKIRKVAANGVITTIAGNGTPGYNGNDLPENATQFYQPHGLITDKQRNIYYADYDNNIIRKITTAGIVTTIAGTRVAGFSGDGGPASLAQLNHPFSLTIDTSGNIFFTDAYNLRIRKIDVNGIITTIAGNGMYGFSGDGGLATTAQISGGYGMATDKTGNLFFTDRSNQRIRKINTAGIITTIAGNGIAGFNGNNISAVTASLNYPDGLAVDTANNILIVDENNTRVRKVNSATGIITAIAGNGSYIFNGGDGGQATAASISIGSIATDTLGNMLIGDFNGYIRKVNAAGIISTIAGGGTNYGDGGLASAAQIQTPDALTIDNQGNLYLTDRDNSRIRKITLVSCGNWTGAFDSNWENSQNWTCEQIPDSNSDVVIHAGNIRINSNVTIRSLHLDPGVSMTVGIGYTLTVLH